nr:7-carboxy-7-deazaguanine synthase [Oceanococcus sp. HetDA_MAG_MS8]
MSYAVKETYFTLQGEGAQTGRAAVFLRFSGCNLWSGREQHRGQGPGGCARWCDTDFVGVDGPGGGRFADADDLAQHVLSFWPGGGRPLVVCTGGEPLLQLDPTLISALHAKGFEIAVESNGTIAAPSGIDWLTISPKPGSKLVQRQGQELKLVYPQVETEAHPDHFAKLSFTHFFLQPLDGPDQARNIQRTVDYCLAHPQWRLSLQTHKVTGLA